MQIYSTRQERGHNHIYQLLLQYIFLRGRKLFNRTLIAQLVHVKSISIFVFPDTVLDIAFFTTKNYIETVSFQQTVWSNCPGRSETILHGFDKYIRCQCDFSDLDCFFFFFQSFSTLRVQASLIFSNLCYLITAPAVLFM